MVLKVFFFTYKVQRPVILIIITFYVCHKCQESTFFVWNNGSNRSRHIAVGKGSALENYMPFG